MAPHVAYWDPENPAFWAREGARIARRNLVVSMAALALSFAVWMLWSIVVVELPHVGFRFTTNQLFWLAAAPGLAGGTLRLVFAFVVPIIGGRRWTVISTLLLLVPAVGLALAVQDPATPYPVLLAAALAAGVGGGNFASSSAHVSFLYPPDRKGAALGLNGGIGNLGVSLAQLVVPAVIGVALIGLVTGAPQPSQPGDTRHALWLQNAGYVWIPAILVVAWAAWRWMDDVDAVRGSFEDQAVVFVRRDTWVLAWLYLGSFGSFIGFAAGFPLVAETEFGGVDVTGFAFVGPLAASLVRPLGGWLADRHGGARVAMVAFVAMAVAIALLAAAPAPLPRFLALFAVLFVASGVANAAVFQMIPATFAAGAERRGDAPRVGMLEAAAALGLASAIGAFGGFFIPKAYGTAVALTGGTRAALAPFLVFYLSCIAVTWWFYVRGARAAPPRDEHAVLGSAPFTPVGHRPAGTSR